MRAIRGRFGLTETPESVLSDDCTRSSGPRPGADDHVRMAGVVDRLERLLGVVYQDIEVVESSIPGLVWRHSSGRWFLDIPTGYPSADVDTTMRELQAALISAVPEVEDRWRDDLVHIAFAAAAARSARGIASYRSPREARRAGDADWGHLPAAPAQAP